MTSFFHDLEEQLRAAAHERTSAPDHTAPRRATAADPPDQAADPPDHAADPPAHPTPRRRGRRGWLAGGARAVPVLAAVAVTLGVVVGALVLLGHRGGQSPTSPASGGPDNTFAALVQNTPKAQLKREGALIAAAGKKVANLPACRQPRPDTGRILRRAAPGTALLSTLGVLRRPARPADRIDPRAFGLGDPGMTIYLDGTRRARTIGQTTYYIVPIHVTPTGASPSPQCAALQTRALKQALPTIPARLRAPTLALQAALISFDRRFSSTTPQDGVCLVAKADRSSSSECGEPLSAIRRPSVPGDDNGSYSGVVPDGVASVTLSFPSSGSHPARSVTGAVHGNVFVVRAVGAPLAANKPPTVTWLAADGRVLKRLVPPSPAALRKLCLNRPEVCAPYATMSSGSSGSAATGSSSPATASSSAAAAKISAKPVRAGRSGTTSK